MNIAEEQRLHQIALEYHRTATTHGLADEDTDRELAEAEKAIEIAWLKQHDHMKDQATMTETTDSPTLDSELYSFATLRIEERARHQITDSIDTDRLAEWFGQNLRNAYQAGLKDGYVQGRHDRHKNGEGEGPL